MRAAGALDRAHAEGRAGICVANERAGGRVPIVGHGPDVNVVAVRLVDEVEVAVGNPTVDSAGLAAVRDVRQEDEPAERGEVARFPAA